MFLPQPVSKKCYYWSTEVFSTLCSLITLSVFELLETHFSARGWWYHCLDSDARQHWKDKLIMPFSLFHSDLEILLFINGNCLLQQHSVTITVAQGTPMTLVCIVWVLRYCLCLLCILFYLFYSVKPECQRHINLFTVSERYRHLLVKWKRIVSPE